MSRRPDVPCAVDLGVRGFDPDLVALLSSLSGVPFVLFLGDHAGGDLGAEDAAVLVSPCVTVTPLTSA
jgi:hypothetical protein